MDIDRRDNLGRQFNNYSIRSAESFLIGIASTGLFSIDIFKYFDLLSAGLSVGMIVASYKILDDSVDKREALQKQFKRLPRGIN